MKKKRVIMWADRDEVAEGIIHKSTDNHPHTHLLTFWRLRQ